MLATGTRLAWSARASVVLPTSSVLATPAPTARRLPFCVTRASPSTNGSRSLRHVHIKSFRFPLRAYSHSKASRWIGPVAGLSRFFVRGICPKGGYWAQTDRRRPPGAKTAIRPTEASKAGVCYVRNTSNSRRPLRPNTGHSPMVGRTGQIDLKRPVTTGHEQCPGHLGPLRPLSLAACWGRIWTSALGCAALGLANTRPRFATAKSRLMFCRS